MFLILVSPVVFLGTPGTEACRGRLVSKVTPATGDQLAAPNGRKGDPGDPGTSGHQGEQRLPGPCGRDFRLLGPDCECYSMNQDMACLLFFVSKVLNKSFNNHVSVSFIWYGS